MSEVKEIPQPEINSQAQEIQRPFKLKPDSRIEISSEEIGFLINLGAIFAPFMRFSQGIQQCVAFAEYLKDTVVKTGQVQFMDEKEFADTSIPVPQSIEEEQKAKEELTKMRVVHTSEVQEELANS